MEHPEEDIAEFRLFISKGERMCVRAEVASGNAPFIYRTRIRAVLRGTCQARHASAQGLKDAKLYKGSVRNEVGKSSFD